MTFDLDAALKKLDSYGADAKRSAAAQIRQEFARLNLLAPELEAYKEIAERQARQIAELSVSLSAFTVPPAPVKIDWRSIEEIQHALREVLAEPKAEVGEAAK